MLLTYKMILEYRICEEIYPEHIRVDVMLLTCKIYPNTEYVKKRYPEHRIGMILLFRKKCSHASSRGQPPIEHSSITK